MVSLASQVFNFAPLGINTQTQTASEQSKPAAPVSTLVWPSKNLSFGFLPTGITTRGMYDLMVMSAALLFGILGFYLLVRPDIGKIMNSTVQSLAPAAEMAMV